MKRVLEFLGQGRVLLMLCMVGLLPASLLGQSSPVTFPTTDGIIGGCAPSGNGTGHLFCATSEPGGLSWEAPPGPATNPPGNGDTSGSTHFVSFTAPNAKNTNACSDFMNGDDITCFASVGTQTSCASSNNNTGTVICAVEGRVSASDADTHGHFTGAALYGVAFYPPPTSPTAHPNSLEGMTEQFVEADDLPNFFDSTSENVGVFAGLPSCTPGNNGQAICAVVVNGANPTSTQILGIELNGTSSTSFVGLPFGSSFTNDPSCTTFFGPNFDGVVADNNNFVAACGIESGNNLIGFAFDPGTGFSVPSSSSTPPLKLLTTGPFLGDPSCGAPDDGGNDVICAVVEGTASSNTLVAIAFNPVTQTLTGSSLNLGAAPSGSWTGGLSCATPNEPAGSRNTLLCAAVTSTNEVFGINFDPRVGASSIAKSTTSVFSQSSTLFAPSCIALAVDSNQISCGISTSTQSFGFNVPLP
jgi:hypothetical protein